MGSGLNVNRYATKKTLSQGMLDIALLTSNAAHLKYVLSVGYEQHEYYTVVLTIIIISLVLQAAAGILFLIIGGMDINNEEYHRQGVSLQHKLHHCHSFIHLTFRPPFSFISNV